VQKGELGARLAPMLKKLASLIAYIDRSSMLPQQMDDESLKQL
jgi:hypothetical protein